MDPVFFMRSQTDTALGVKGKGQRAATKGSQVYFECDTPGNGTTDL